MSILTFENYKPFKKIIFENKKEFLILVFLLFIEILVLTSAVVSSIPLVDFIIDPNLKNPNKFTLFILKFIEFLNLKPSLILFLTFFVLSNIIKSALSIAVYNEIIKIKNFIEIKYTKNFSKIFLESGIKFFENKDSGLLLNTSTKIIQNISEGFSQVALQFSFIFRLCIYMIIPILLDWKIFLTIFFLVLIFSFPFRYFNSFGNRWANYALKSNSKFLHSLSETFNAIKIVFGYNLQNFSLSRIIEPLKEYLSFQKKKITTEFFILNSIQPLMLVCVSFIFVFFYSDTNDLSKFAGIFWSLISAFPILSQLVKGDFSLASLQPSLEQYDSLCKEGISLSETNFLKNKTKKSLTKSIELKNVYFSHSQENLILENCNLKIYKNEFVLIIGKSGIGKSTLIDLLMGFHKPNRGEIFIDNENLDNLNIFSFRNLIGYVPQDPFLFNTTVKNNLLLSNSKASLHDIIDIIKVTNCEEFINKFKDGLDTIVGDKGSNMSGGQRQRLALARALIKNPEILIMDEPTNALDSYSSDLIYSTIRKLKKKMTIILISHQTLKKENFDKILFIENKKIKEIK